MPDDQTVPPLDGAVITGVRLVDQITRPERRGFRSVSLPGHLLHVVTDGRVELRASGVREVFGPGESVWYYENETVNGRILDAPWTFYTVNFTAPALAPPSPGERVKPVGPLLIERMESLLQTWRDVTAAPTLRHLRIHALLLEVLLEVLPEQAHAHRVDEPTLLWWTIEEKLRADLSQPIDLRLLQRLSGRSQRSIIRACHLAVGTSPIKRIRQLRLSYARGLVQLSKLPMTDIALQVGYGRVQEFSRDYHKHLGVTPTEDRKTGPSYRQLELPDNAE